MLGASPRSGEVLLPIAAASWVIAIECDSLRLKSMSDTIPNMISSITGHGQWTSPIRRFSDQEMAVSPLPDLHVRGPPTHRLYLKRGRSPTDGNDEHVAVQQGWRCSIQAVRNCLKRIWEWLPLDVEQCGTRAKEL